MITPLPNKQFFPTQLYKLKGRVVHGFGRGSKLLGFPTANLDPKAFLNTFNGVERGVYLGYVQILKPDTIQSTTNINSDIHKAMISLGTNPQFDTKEDTLEAFIDYKYDDDFYGYEMRLIICAYVRPQLKFSSIEELISTIQTDVDLGRIVLERPEYKELLLDTHFVQK